MKSVLYAGIALMSGCAAVPGDTVEVRIPVPVPCVAEVPRAVFPAGPELAAMDDYRLVLALARDRLEREAHIARLEAILYGCTAP